MAGITMFVPEAAVILVSPIKLDDFATSLASDAGLLDIARPRISFELLFSYQSIHDVLPSLSLFITCLTMA